MSVRIRYMGTKQRLAHEVAGSVAGLRPHAPFIDLFCGMCSVAGAVADSGRPVWVNDIQRYATDVARCLLTSGDGPPTPTAFLNAVSDHAAVNRQALTRRFLAELDTESAVLDAPTLASYASAYGGFRHAANDASVAAEAARMAMTPSRAPYRMATLTFAWGYLGLMQAIEFDSLRMGIDRALAMKALSVDEAAWGRVALMQAAARIAAAPGHLAQYLHAETEGGLDRVVRQRRRDLNAQTLLELGELAPFGDAPWRRGNRVLEEDALTIWPAVRRHGLEDAVVYADPPYSKNQYSRFYHVLESLARYDYPPASGRGRYRPDRFRTGFCERRAVRGSFELLCSAVAGLGFALVLSYPTDGLLHEVTGHGPEVIIARHFGRCEVALKRATKHSTLGGRHGRRDHTTEETVLIAE